MAAKSTRSSSTIAAVHEQPRQSKHRYSKQQTEATAAAPAATADHFSTGYSSSSTLFSVLRDSHQFLASKPDKTAPPVASSHTAVHLWLKIETYCGDAVLWTLMRREQRQYTEGVLVVPAVPPAAGVALATEMTPPPPSPVAAQRHY